MSKKFDKNNFHIKDFKIRWLYRFYITLHNKHDYYIFYIIMHMHSVLKTGLVSLVRSRTDALGQKH